MLLYQKVEIAIYVMQILLEKHNEVDFCKKKCL